MIDRKLSEIIITNIDVLDIRFSFDWGGSGSDANNPKTDYSNPYVVLKAGNYEGIGIGFTLGRGNEMVCQAVLELKELITGVSLYELLTNFSYFWRKLANPLQSRWIGPVSGPYYMAAGAIVNAIFDLWGKVEKQPLWSLLSRLSPQEVVNMIDFRYVSHVLSEEEAVLILEESQSGLESRIESFKENGLNCYYTTWIGTENRDLLDQIHRVREEKGIQAFKFKVGRNLEDDRDRLALVRKEFGSDIQIMTDANQVWSVREAIEWMSSLKDFDPVWIEEPVAPDMILGHGLIKQELSRLGIDVVSGENCPNSHIASQFISSGSLDRFQIDACRVIGPPENMLIMLIAKKFNIPVCPHAGGSGLDELVPHLAAWNAIALDASQEKVVVEQVGFCSHHFLAPSLVFEGRLQLPLQAGYIVGMHKKSISEFVRN